MSSSYDSLLPANSINSRAEKLGPEIYVPAKSSQNHTCLSVTPAPVYSLQKSLIGRIRCISIMYRKAVSTRELNCCIVVKHVWYTIIK